MGRDVANSLRGYASCLIVGYRLFEGAASPHVVEVLKEAVERYGKPRSMLSNRRVQFCAEEA